MALVKTSTFAAGATRSSAAKRAVPPVAADTSPARTRPRQSVATRHAQASRSELVRPPSNWQAV